MSCGFSNDTLKFPEERVCWAPNSWMIWLNIHDLGAPLRGVKATRKTTPSTSDCWDPELCPHNAATAAAAGNGGVWKSTCIKFIEMPECQEFHLLLTCDRLFFVKSFFLSHAQPWRDETNWLTFKQKHCSLCWPCTAGSSDQNTRGTCKTPQPSQPASVCLSHANETCKGMVFSSCAKNSANLPPSSRKKVHFAWIIYIYIARLSTISQPDLHAPFWHTERNGSIHTTQMHGLQVLNWRTTLELRSCYLKETAQHFKKIGVRCRSMEHLPAATSDPSKSGGCSKKKCGGRTLSLRWQKYGALNGFPTANSASIVLPDCQLSVSPIFTHLFGTQKGMAPSIRHKCMVCKS